MFHRKRSLINQIGRKRTKNKTRKNAAGCREIVVEAGANASAAHFYGPAKLERR